MLSAAVIHELASIVGRDRVKTAAEKTAVYSYDASPAGHPPEVVLFPDSTDQVSRVLELANRHKIAVSPRGAGTNLSGGSLPLSGGIVMVMTKMNRILEVDPENLLAVVEPGVVNADLQEHLGQWGLFYPPDPASMNVCTIGGNVGEGSGGPRCLKYGVTRDYVLGLEVVLPTGEVIRTGGLTHKNSTGYDFTRLFVGSEGTLGVATKIWLRLVPLPEDKRTLVAVFADIKNASKMVSAVIARKIVPATLELMDNLLIRCAEDFVHMGLPVDAGCLMIIEVDGFKESLDRQTDIIASICKEHEATEIRIARSPAQVEQLWKARRSVLGAATRVRPSYSLQDVTVPRSRLPQIIARIIEISRDFAIPIGILAHAGDGNLHPTVLYDSNSPEEREKVDRVEEEICRAALNLGGTLSGEHGIGVSKRRFLPLEYSEKMMELSRDIRKVFDPNGIMNPGKIVEV